MRGNWSIRLLIIIIVVGTIFIPAKVVNAYITGIVFTVTPQTVPPNVNATFGFTVGNIVGEQNPIFWIKITTPSDNFTFNSASVESEWVVDVNSNNILLTEGVLLLGDTLSIIANVGISNVEAPPLPWIVEVSDNSNGSNPYIFISTERKHMTDIVDNSIDKTAPTISNISIDNITPSSADISWATNEPASSTINYGTSASYGTKSSSQDYKLTHSFKLTGLKPKTTYYYQMVSIDTSNNKASIGNNTFTTKSVDTIVITPPTTAEKIPPTVNLNELNAIYNELPIIGGKANDNAGISRVEISFDGGKSWQKISDVSGLNTTKATFSFTTTDLDDGKYSIVARATDLSGNGGISETQEIIIDRGPPILASIDIAAKGYDLPINSNGEVIAVVGLEQIINARIAFGATKVWINATGVGEPNIVHRFDMIRQEVGNLWYSPIVFEKSGKYSLELTAVDSVNNILKKDFLSIDAIESGHIVDVDGPVNNATVEVYRLDTSKQRWKLWDGRPFDQVNPQVAGDNGEYGYILPPGSYYIQVISPNHVKAVSNIFSVDSFAPLEARVELVKRPEIRIGKLSLKMPRIGWSKFSADTDTVQRKTSLPVGQLESLNIIGTDGSIVTKRNLLGKPTVLTLLTSWSANSAEQLDVLGVLNSKKTVNVLPVFSAESKLRIGVLKKIGNLDIDLYVDEKADIQNNLGVRISPTHLFIGRKGNVTKIIHGLMSQEEIVNELRGVR